MAKRPGCRTAASVSLESGRRAVGALGRGDQAAGAARTSRGAALY